MEALSAQRCLELLAEFTEVESGKRNNRPVLAQALHHAKITNAVLVIAKLDRLSRNAAFLLTLRDSGIRFLAADVPDANDLTIGVLAVIAQAEREAISKRTKEALAAIRQKIDDGEEHISARSGRVVKRLGSPLGGQAFGCLCGDLSAARDAKAVLHRERLQDIKPVIAAIRADGFMSLTAIAVELNRRGVATPRSGKWHASTVLRYAP